jgi:hypothetical protein
MNFFGTLMWINEESHSSPNNKNKKIDSYFRQIELLANTLRAVFDADLLVFTNDPARVSAWFREKKTPLQVMELTPSIAVPAGIRFFSAHYKLDALMAGLGLLQTETDRFILLDTDVIANYPFSDEQAHLLSRADLVVYDISDQVFPAYGAATVIGDIERVSGDSFVDPKWFGGEFIAASQRGLSRLIRKTQELLPDYFANINTLHHIGDEMFITAGLNALLKDPEGLRIVSQTPYRVISRHWSRHTDRPLHYHMEHSFIHCPGSKPVLEFLSLVGTPRRCLVLFCLRFYQIVVLTYQLTKKKFK